MSIVSAVIPNLINGVSQQPFALRLASQGELQENGLSSVAEGLMKRPNTRHIAKLMSSPTAGAYIHTINRDEIERYVVVIQNQSLRVFDFAGNEKTVNFPHGTGYLQAADPAKTFSAVTVADYTFIVNRTIKTEMQGSTVAARAPEALIWVRQGNYSTTYTINIDNGAGVYSYTTPNGTTAATDPDIQKQEIDAAAAAIRTDAIAEQLRALVAANSAYTVERLGSVLWLRRANGADFALSVSDSFGDEALLAIKGSVQTFSDLPRRAKNGFEVTIEGSPNNAFDSYYVRYDDTNTIQGIGTWRETAKPGRKYILAAWTMPYGLIREANGTFTFKQLPWENAGVGDDKTNPEPSFLGRAVSDIFFFRNRLGFISDENVVFSRTGDYFNLFRSTVTQFLETDPIDVAVSHTKVSNLRHAIPFNESLLLFSDNTQFILQGSDVLTAQTASINQSTEFETSLDARPIGAGRNVYFATEQGGFSGIREYYIDSDTNTKDANDVTSHVRRYIPGGVFRLSASTNEDIMLVLTRGDRSAVYVYKWFYSGDEKVQSSWSRWSFDPDADILDVALIESTAWFVIQRPDGVFLERLNLERVSNGGPSSIPILLDRRALLADCTVTYASATDTTSVTLPYVFPSIRAVVGDGAPNGFPRGYILTPVEITGNTVVLAGDWRNTHVYLGVPYEFRYRFSPFLLRDEAPGGGQVATTEGRLQITFASLNYSESGYFRTEVTPFRRDTYTRIMSGRVLGSATSNLDEIAVNTGVFRFPIVANNLQVTVDLVNDSHLPCRFLNAEWEGRYTVRSQRRN